MSVHMHVGAYGTWCVCIYMISTHTLVAKSSLCGVLHYRQVTSVHQ